MDKKSQNSATYDEMFEKGGSDGIFDLPYRHSSYYPMYKAVLKAIRRFNVDSVLEVDCGTGAFAHMLLDNSKIGYRGFDFSQIAVEKAQTRTAKCDLFYVADALNDNNYVGLDDAIICTEVLEHIPQDLELIAKWPSGTLCICTVPNFDSPYHVRYFSQEKNVEQRYKDVLDFRQIHRIKKPALPNISLRNRLRELRWQRYRPKRLVELLGLGNFDKVGGWFLFIGTRR